MKINILLLSTLLLISLTGCNALNVKQSIPVSIISQKIYYDSNGEENGFIDFSIKKMSDMNSLKYIVDGVITDKNGNKFGREYMEFDIYGNKTREMMFDIKGRKIKEYSMEIKGNQKNEIFYSGKAYIRNIELYDKGKRILKKSSWNENGVMEWEDEYSYNANSLVEKELYKDGKGNINGGNNYIYEYDENNNPVRIEKTANDGTVYEELIKNSYNENKQLIKAKYLTKDGEEKYSYIFELNNEGKKETVSKLDEYGNITQKLSYDNENRLIEKYNSDGQNTFYWIGYTYNKDSQITEERFINVNGDIEMKIESRYSEVK